MITICLIKWQILILGNERVLLYEHAIKLSFRATNFLIDSRLRNVHEDRLRQSTFNHAFTFWNFNININGNIGLLFMMSCCYLSFSSSKLKVEFKLHKIWKQNNWYLFEKLKECMKSSTFGLVFTIIAGAGNPRIAISWELTPSPLH